MFTIPEFPLLCNVWDNLHPPPHAPRAQFRCNLTWAKRVHDFSTPAAVATLQLLLPAGTDIRAQVQGAAQRDLVECPAGTGRFYLSIAVDDIGKGFANEHRCAVIEQTAAAGTWPIPMP